MDVGDYIEHLEQVIELLAKYPESRADLTRQHGPLWAFPEEQAEMVWCTICSFRTLPGRVAMLGLHVPRVSNSS